MLAGSATLCFEYAPALLFASDRYAAATAAQVEMPLRLAEEAWQQAEEKDGLGQVLAVRAMVALWQGDLENALAHAQAALQLLPGQDLFWRGSALTSSASRS